MSVDKKILEEISKYNNINKYITEQETDLPEPIEVIIRPIIASVIFFLVALAGLVTSLGLDVASLSFVSSRRNKFPRAYFFA